PKCEESRPKVKAAQPIFEVRRFPFLGCGFSLFGLHYPLRKPRRVVAGRKDCLVAAFIAGQAAIKGS
ncbi:MAG: hypothetical protein U9R72_04325, partial [Chloroflexota bacterium]|nr:hypothetical protein [Chloroflexota bacterium]